MRDLIILTDYRGAFYSSTTNVRTFCSMDVEKLHARFTERGWHVTVAGFPEVDHQADWSGKMVLYQSAEDPGLEYKSYIEDVILGLVLAGANIIPDFPYLRAHHNKAFGEILCKSSHLVEANTLSSSVFGTYEDFRGSNISYPVVAKTSAGAGSSGITLLKNEQEAASVLRRMSRCRLDVNVAKELVKRRIISGYVPYSIRRRKFVLQEYIPDLSHDFKILIYGTRVFVLRREVRDNDFRASGSGKFSWPRELPDGLLDFAWELLCGFDVPHASFDIVESKGTFYLIEAQFVDFGPLTLEKATFHWARNEDGWKCVESGAELESTFADGITRYAQKKGWLLQCGQMQVMDRV